MLWYRIHEFQGRLGKTQFSQFVEFYGSSRFYETNTCRAPSAKNERQREAAVSISMISESEWLTRKKRIDSRLTALGWKIVRFSGSIVLASLNKVAVEELPTASGPADYGLFVAGRLLGIVEAKKVTVNPQNVS